MVCSDCEGEAGFYSLIVGAGESRAAIMEMALRAGRGQGEDGSVLLASWRSSGR